MIQQAIIRGLLVVLVLWGGITLLRQNALLRADLRASKAETEQVLRQQETDRSALTSRLRAAEALHKRKEAADAALEIAVQDPAGWGAQPVPAGVRAALGMCEHPCGASEPSQRAY